MAIIVSNPSKLNEKKTVYFISVLLVNEKLMQYKLWNTFFTRFGLSKIHNEDSTLKLLC
jgi:hypothetical protein